MPSISTIVSGYIFGPVSVPMLYMMPAIWLGNFALIFSFKYLMLKKKNYYWVSAVVGIIAKVLIIFGLFNLINLFGVFPAKAVPTLQKSMGLIQLITASIGCVIGYAIYKIEGAKK